MNNSIESALLDKSAWDIVEDDFIRDGGFSGTVTRTTEKAIAIEVSTGRWVGSYRDRYKTIWVPRSIITVYRAIRGDYNGVLESAEKTFFEIELPAWWYRNNKV